MIHIIKYWIHIIKYWKLKLFKWGINFVIIKKKKNLAKAKLKRFHSLIWIFLNEKKFNILNIKTLIQKLDLYKIQKRYSIMQLLRISLVGSLKGLDLFFIISIIGKKESLKRIIKFINYCL
ncbi:MAG: hypothetical protein ACFS26_00820 [Candidatus Karelsulcia muelleri]